MAFSYDLKGIKGLQKKLEKVTKDILQDIDGDLKEFVTKTNREQVQRAAKFNGELHQDTDFRKDDTANYTLFSNAPHALFQEFGTGDYYKPIAGIKTPPYEKRQGEKGDFFKAILNWVKKKGIAGRFSTKTRQKLNSKADKAREEEAARAIYWHIIQHGTKPHPFFYGPFLENRKQLVKTVAGRLKNIK